MNVYFQSAFSGKGKGPLGSPQSCKLFFQYNGIKRCIPVIYRFPKGIVFDIISLYQDETLRRIVDRYGKNEEELSFNKKRALKQVTLFMDIPLQEIRIDGEKTEKGFSYSSMTYLPWIDEDKDVMKEIKDMYAYLLTDVNCFGIHRFCVPYPKNKCSLFHRLHRRVKPVTVKNLTLLTEPSRRYDPMDISVTMTSGEEKSVQFLHPVTGKEHTVYFQRVMPLSIPLSGHDSVRIFCGFYEFLPGLSEGESLVFDNEMQLGKGFAANRRDFKEAASVGIIGGADGPTSIFLSKGKGDAIQRGNHGLPLFSCYSLPTDSSSEEGTFAIKGIEKKEPMGKEYSFVLNFA